LEQYWEYTPKKLEKFASVYRQREEQKAREWDMMNFLLGRYVMYAVNSPKDYPQQPYLSKGEQKQEGMTDEEMDRMMLRTAIRHGGIIKSNKLQQ